MSERPDGADGLGRSSSGTPDFERPDLLAAPAPASLSPTPLPPQILNPLAPRPSRGPAVVTAVVVLLVAAVAAFGTLAAWRADTEVSAPPASTSHPATPSTADPGPNSILFTGGHGTGRLSVRDHTWEPGSPGRLQLEVELTCTTGTVDHGPDSFLLYDTDGNVVEPELDEGPGSIDYGTLGPGERVRGNVVFHLSRQVVTLVLSDTAGSVAALQITD